MDFGNCYNDLKESNTFSEDENITTILIDIPRQNQSFYTYYNFFNSEKGTKLEFVDVCKNNKVTKTIDLFSYNMNNIENKKEILSQNIDILNKSSPFFTDICFKFESPVKKDIPLNERILNYYPNIKLCDDECINKGIDYEKYEVICECTFSNILNNNIVNNYFTGEVINLISETNLDVLKCYKSVFSFEDFKENYGGLIILSLILIQIILNIIYIKNGFIKERQYTLGILYFYIKTLNIKNDYDKETILNNCNLDGCSGLFIRV